MEIRRFILSGLTGVLHLVATAAVAQDTLSLDTLDLYPTMASVSALIAYSGDDDMDATARVEYRRVGDLSFIEGHTLVRLPGGRFAGSVLYLEADTGYEVRAVAEDPDNAGPLSMTSMVRTRADSPPAGSGADWYVDAGRGLDTNPGTMADPFATIQAGAEAAGPGDTVHVLPGVYREQVVPPRGGAPGAPLRFQAEGAGVVLDGSDPAIEAGVSWTDAGGGLFWTPFAGESIYVAVDDTRIYDYQSLQDLAEENGNIGVPGAIAGGFFVDEAADGLYLITPDHSDPTFRSVHVAILGSAFLLDTITDVVVEGFEIRYYGRTRSYGGVGVDVRDSARCWVRGNTIHHLNTGVRVRRSQASENVIEENSVRDTSVYGWPWSSVKSHTPEASAVSITHGHGNVVRWNDLEGTFNGIYTGAFGDDDEEIARDTDVYENTLRYIGDDGLEMEGAQRNVRCWENIVRDVFNAVSLAPIEAGPVFLVRNVLWGYASHALKVNNGTYGWVFIYHTTAVPQPGATHPDAQAIEPSIPFGAITMRNNIWEANRYVIEYGQTSLAGPVDWDLDALWTWDVAGAGRFVKWLDVRYPDMAALAASGTIEANGFQVVPEYEDPATGDFTLVAGHALLDAGEVIPGINDAFIVGPGPDVGAFERGGIVPGPDDPRVEVLRSGLAADLPADPDDRFPDVFLPWVDPDAVVGNPGLPALLFYEVAPSTRPILVAREPNTVRIEFLP